MPRNILFIMCDQLRWDYLSCYGHKTLHTPNIDSWPNVAYGSTTPTARPLYAGHRARAFTVAATCRATV